MARFHKLLSKLLSEVTHMTSKNTDERIITILKSYELQTKYGIDRLEAFENSVLNPTLKPNEKKENQIAMNKAKSRSKKIQTLERYKQDIQKFRKQGMSYQGIANYLNSHRVSNKNMKFNKVDISRYFKRIETL